MHVTKLKFDAHALASAAIAARQNAYAPYSGFLVGAALLAKDGRVFTGCNVENAAYSVCNCAERTALFSAVAAGAQDFCAIAIAGAKKEHTLATLPDCLPCGVCRQALSEFCDEDFCVVLALGEGNIKTYTLGELLAHPFKL